MARKKVEIMMIAYKSSSAPDLSWHEVIAYDKGNPIGYGRIKLNGCREERATVEVHPDYLWRSIDDNIRKLLSVSQSSSKAKSV
jgi:hypothetical protein